MSPTFSKTMFAPFVFLCAKSNEFTRHMPTCGSAIGRHMCDPTVRIATSCTRGSCAIFKGFNDMRARVPASSFNSASSHEHAATDTPPLLMLRFQEPSTQVHSAPEADLAVNLCLPIAPHTGARSAAPHPIGRASRPWKGKRCCVPLPHVMPWRD